MQKLNSHVIRIPSTEIRGKGRDDVTGVVLQHLYRTPETQLPLQSACRFGGWADGSDREIVLIDSQSDDTWMTVRVTVYFSEIVGGCNCNDDPVSHPAVARLRIATRLSDGETTISLAGER